MSDAPEILRFRIDRGELKLPEFVEAVKKAMEELSPLAVVRTAVSPSFWVAAARSAADLVRDLVDVRVADVLVGAWKTHRKLTKFTNPVLYPPGQSTIVPIAVHHITATQSPYIEIFIDGQPQGKIEFELELDVAVEGGSLVIQNGRIMRLEAGQAKATGTLKCGGVVVAERTSRDVAWTDGISFGEGIQITAAT